MLFVCSNPGCLRVDNTALAEVLATDREPKCRICVGIPWFFVFGMRGLDPRRRYNARRDGPMDSRRRIKGADAPPPVRERSRRNRRRHPSMKVQARRINRFAARNRTMGEGLVSAALAAIATQEWTVEGKRLSGHEVAALYAAIPNRTQMCRAVGAAGRSDRRFDRAMQVLRKAGLVKFVRGQWRRLHETHEPPSDERKEAA